MKEPTARRAAPLGADEISVLCYQLSLMERSGIPCEEGVSLLERDARESWARELLGGVRQRLAAGAPLSAALEASGAFPAYLIRMVEIAQVSGRLEEVLRALSEYYKREAATRGAVRRAVAYPCLMAVLVSLVFFVLTARVLPVFQSVFGELGMALPPAAAALLRLGSAGKAVSAAVSVLLVLCALFLLWLFRTRAGEGFSRRLGTALFGRSASALALARSRFASAMALMLSSGLAIDEAMERTVRLLADSPLAGPLGVCQEKMNAGESFPKAVEGSGVLDPLQSGLLAAGFRAGVSEEAMAELAARCAEETDERLGRLLGRFEFALVAVLCVSVGLVLLSVMLPLLGVLGAVGA